MQTRSIRGSGQPVWVNASLKCVLLIGTRSVQSIMASGFTAAQTGRTHDRTRPMLQQLRRRESGSTPQPSVRAGLIEFIEGRNDVLTVFRVWIHVLAVGEEGDVFGY